MGSRHVTAGNGERANIVICFFYPSYTSAILFAVLPSPQAFFLYFFSCRISVSSLLVALVQGREKAFFAAPRQEKKALSSFSDSEGRGGGGEEAKKCARGK